MRFDPANIELEFALFAATVIWWILRTPATPRRRISNLWYSSSSPSTSSSSAHSENSLPPSSISSPPSSPLSSSPSTSSTFLFGLFVRDGNGIIVSFPFESLCVNVASLTGTLLSDALRPSQAIFSVALVLADAWPLLFVPSTTGSVPVVRNWIRFAYIFGGLVLSTLVLWLVGGEFGARLMHAGSVLAGDFAALGAVFVALRAIADYSTAQNRSAAPDFMLDSSSSNSVQHIALIGTYFVYAVMLFIDFSFSETAGACWYIYCSGSIAVEMVKFWFVNRAKSMNVVTTV